jgi:DNA gyrase inhibitor GyrI
LIERLWNASSEKKLKQDQVESLISWAKEDYFEDEVSAVLAVLRDQS